MKIEEQNFQKRLAIWPLLGTSIAAIGAIIVTYGLSILLFGTQLSVDSIEANNTTKQNLEILSKVATTNGWTITITGTVLLIGGPILTTFLIVNEKIRRKKKSKSIRHSVLFDEMYDGKDIELEKKGYDAHSVKKLRLTGEPLRYDHSVLKYVEENRMILVTEDPENYGGCQENNLPCIKLGQNPSIEEIINALESLKTD